MFVLVVKKMDIQPCGLLSRAEWSAKGWIECSTLFNKDTTFATYNFLTICRVGVFMVFFFLDQTCVQGEKPL